MCRSDKLKKKIVVVAGLSSTDNKLKIVLGFNLLLLSNNDIELEEKLTVQFKSATTGVLNPCRSFIVSQI